eukprot:jgi/Psemu1/18470/gm1.18470_g
MDARGEQIEEKPRGPMRLSPLFPAPTPACFTGTDPCPGSSPEPTPALPGTDTFCGEHPCTGTILNRTTTFRTSIGPLLTPPNTRRRQGLTLPLYRHNNYHPT